MTAKFFQGAGIVVSSGRAARAGCRFHRIVSMVSIVPRSRSGTLAGSAETSALIQAAETSGPVGLPSIGRRHGRFGPDAG